MNWEYAHQVWININHPKIGDVVRVISSPIRGSGQFEDILIRDDKLKASRIGNLYTIARVNTRESVRNQFAKFPCIVLSSLTHDYCYPGFCLELVNKK